MVFADNNKNCIDNNYILVDIVAAVVVVDDDGTD
jgi:hypothetical protein